MLSDISNTSETLMQATDLHKTTNLKRPLPGPNSDGSHQKVRRDFASSSSSSFAGSSSPGSFAFADTRYNAYDAPSSPLPASLMSKDTFLSSPARNTLSTSSIGAPSSPCFDRAATVASPVAPRKNSSIEGTDDSLTLRLERGTLLQFGRKAKKVTRNFDSSPKTTSTTLCILLPRSAKNASRLHCTAEILPVKNDMEDGSVRVQISVMGQNGMKVDGELWKAGSLSSVKCTAGQKLSLDFWGWQSTVIIAESEVLEESRPITLESSMTSSVRGTCPIESSFDHDDSPNNLDDGDLFDDNPYDLLSSPVPALKSTSSRSRLPSPVYSELSDLSDSPSSPAPHHTDLSDNRAAQLSQTLNLDLPGLIASTIVFHPRSTVGVEEVVKAMLKEVGSMWDILEGGKADEEKEEEAVEAWWDVIETVLREEQFFGCIENVGLKDAAGNPLPPAYYYLPDEDPSKSRVEALAPFVRRVRGARVAGGGKRYFWRRPSMKKNK